MLEAVILPEQTEQLRRCVLHRLVERPRVPDGHHELTVVCARPVDPLALEHLDGELDVHGYLDAGADDLTVSLQRVPVADVEEGALDEDGEVDGDALAEAAVVHVA